MSIFIQTFIGIDTVKDRYSYYTVNIVLLGINKYYKMNN